MNLYNRILKAINVFLECDEGVSYEWYRLEFGARMGK